MLTKALKNNFIKTPFAPLITLVYPVTQEFQGFHLLDGKYQEIQPTADGKLWSHQLELYLGVHEGKLRYFTLEQKLILTSCT